MKRNISLHCIKKVKIMLTNVILCCNPIIAGTGTTPWYTIKFAKENIAEEMPDVSSLRRIFQFTR